MVKDRGADVDRGDQTALVGRLGAELVRAAAGEARGGGPQQLVPGAVGRALQDDQKLPARACAGQLAQVLRARRSVGQVRDHERPALQRAVTRARSVDAGPSEARRCGLPDRPRPRRRRRRAARSRIGAPARDLARPAGPGAAAAGHLRRAGAPCANRRPMRPSPALASESGGGAASGRPRWRPSTPE